MEICGQINENLWTNLWKFVNEFMEIRGQIYGNLWTN